MPTPRTAASSTSIPHALILTPAQRRAYRKAHGVTRFRIAQAAAADLDAGFHALSELLPVVLAHLTTDRGDPQPGVDPQALATLRLMETSMPCLVSAAEETCGFMRDWLAEEGTQVRLAV